MTAVRGWEINRNNTLQRPLHRSNSTWYFQFHGSLQRSGTQQQYDTYSNFIWIWIRRLKGWTMHNPQMAARLNSSDIPRRYNKGADKRGHPRTLKNIWTGEVLLWRPPWHHCHIPKFKSCKNLFQPCLGPFNRPSSPKIINSFVAYYNNNTKKEKNFTKRFSIRVPVKMSDFGVSQAPPWENTSGPTGKTISSLKFNK